MKSFIQILAERYDVLEEKHTSTFDKIISKVMPKVFSIIKSKNGTDTLCITNIFLEQEPQDVKFAELLRNIRICFKIIPPHSSIKQTSNGSASVSYKPDITNKQDKRQFNKSSNIITLFKSDVYDEIPTDKEELYYTKYDLINNKLKTTPLINIIVYLDRSKITHTQLEYINNNLRDTLIHELTHVYHMLSPSKEAELGIRPSDHIRHTYQNAHGSYHDIPAELYANANMLFKSLKHKRLKQTLYSLLDSYQTHPDKSKSEEYKDYLTRLYLIIKNHISKNALLPNIETIITMYIKDTKHE